MNSIVWIYAIINWHLHRFLHYFSIYFDNLMHSNFCYHSSIASVYLFMNLYLPVLWKVALVNFNFNFNYKTINFSIL